MLASAINCVQNSYHMTYDSYHMTCYVHDLQSQEKEARDEMKRKAKELEMARREDRKSGRHTYTGGFGAGSGYGSRDRMGGTMVDTLPPPEHTKSYSAPRCVCGVCLVFITFSLCVCVWLVISVLNYSLT